MNRYILLFASILILTAGYFLYAMFFKKPVVVFYVENNSFDLPKVDLKVRIDDVLLINDSFKVDSVAPAFSVYKLQLQKGSHVLNVGSSALPLNMIDTLEMRENKYVFVSFNYKIKSRYVYEQEKRKFELSYPKERYPDKVFRFDSIAIKPEIKIHMTKEKPILH